MILEVIGRSEEYDFELLGGALCLDFVNTVGSKLSSDPHEHLGTYGDLLAWGATAGAITQSEAEVMARRARAFPAQAQEVLARAIALRDALNSIFMSVAARRDAPEHELGLLNEELSRASARLRVAGEGGAFRWTWDDGAPALDRMLWPVAREAAELLTQGDLRRVRACEGETCGWLFLDLSKNRSRRWCDMSDCGNRAKAKRHYTRKRAQTATEHTHA